jgi:hypothetical protein
MVIFSLYKSLLISPENSIEKLCRCSDEKNIVVLVLHTIICMSKKESLPYQLDVTKILLSNPSLTLLIDIWWRIALSEKQWSSERLQLKQTGLPFNKNPSFTYRYVYSELFYRGMSSSHLKDVLVPDFLEDKTILSKLSHLITIICLTASKEELVILLKPVLLSSHASTYVYSILSLERSYQEMLLPLIFLIMRDDMRISSVVYWKFRCLAIDLSIKNLSYCRIIRDLLLDSNDFQELCVDLSIDYLDDIVEIIDNHAENIDEMDINHHAILSNLVESTLRSIMSKISSKLLAAESWTSATTSTTQTAQNSLSTRMRMLAKAAAILSHILYTKYNLCYIDSMQIAIQSMVDRIQNMTSNESNCLSHLHVCTSLTLTQLVLIYSERTSTESIIADQAQRMKVYWKLLEQILEISTQRYQSEDGHQAHLLLYDIVKWKSDADKLRDLCLLELGLDRIDNLLPIAMLSGWQEVVNQWRLMSSDNEMLDHQEASLVFIENFNRLAKPLSISSISEEPCDWITCLGFILQAGFMSEYEELHDLMLYATNVARFPPHSRILSVVSLWIDVTVRKPSADSVWMKPVMPNELKQITDKFANYSLNQFHDLIYNSPTHLCRACFGEKDGGAILSLASKPILKLPSTESISPTKNPITALSIDTIVDYLQRRKPCQCAQLIDTSADRMDEGDQEASAAMVAWPALLAVYSALRYIRQSRDIHQSHSILFAVDVSDLPIRRLLQILSLPQVIIDPCARSMMDEIIRLLQNISPDFLLPDRIDSLSWRSWIAPSTLTAIDEERLLSSFDPSLLQQLVSLPLAGLHQLCCKTLFPKLLTDIDSSEIAYEYIHAIDGQHVYSHRFHLLLINWLLDHPSTVTSSAPRIITSYRILVQEPMLLFRIDISQLMRRSICRLIFHILKAVITVSNANTVDICRLRKARSASTKQQRARISKYPTLVDLEECVDPVLFNMLQDVMICKLLLQLSKDAKSANKPSIDDLVVDMMLFLRQKNKDLIRALMHFEVIHDSDDWTLLFSSSLLHHDTAEIIVSMLKRRPRKTKHFVDSLSYAMSHLRYSSGDVDAKLIVNIQENLITFLLDASPSHVTVFHPVEQNEMVDGFVSELLDILVRSNPAKAFYLFKTIIRSTDGYANKRYKDIFRAKYVQEEVTNIEDFAAKILKDESYLIEEEAIILMDDEIMNRGDNVRMAGRKRSYSFGEPLIP